MKLISAIILSLFLLPSCDKPEQATGTEPETLVREYDESGMEEAISIARSRIDEFLKVLRDNDADSFSVKAPIKDENGTEHFWLTEVSYKDGVFHGVIGNDPGIVKNVNFGQSWSIKRDSISDWMYVRSGMIHGGFTIDPLLDSYPKEDADALRAKLVR
ncbi:YegJ family protein [Verrucomicrobiaceae bacterium 5K15]|uniref:YegJ family protein n=1 Tax=Oceaniferula flava TaxID=2800421 RepID=A0AAE2VDL9_9BACT|nr:DUF2314 domain-containing protein [Oceaniferula flavus]MBK1854759.1 YegJ family protein [Oceaniferula flavus]MBM1136065.1 YegJ family protein [Oceaniferula flavus]